MSPLDLAFLAVMSAILFKILADFTVYMNGCGKTFREELREIFKKEV